MREVAGSAGQPAAPILRRSGPDADPYTCTNAPTDADSNCTSNASTERGPISDAHSEEHSESGSCRIAAVGRVARSRGVAIADCLIV